MNTFFTKSNLKQKIQGFTALEISIVLIVIILIIVFSLRHISRVFEESDIAKDVVLIQQIVHNTKLRKTVDGYGNSDITLVLINTGAIPKEALSGNSIINAFGGIIQVNGTATTIEIRYQAGKLASKQFSSQEICAKLGLAVMKTGLFEKVNPNSDWSNKVLLENANYQNIYNICQNKYRLVFITSPD